jgi:cell division transport system permease protein
MKFSSFRYLVREGFRNLWQNRFMALASIGVLVSCLLLTGGSYLVFRNIDHFFEWVYGQNVVVAFADADSTDDESAAIQEKLQAITNVEKVEFISKEDLLERYKDSFPEVLLEDLREDNPLQDSFIVTFTDLSKFDATIMQIQQVENIDTVEYEPEIANMLTNVRKIVLAVGGWIIALLLLVSLFIIANTIKLTVYNRRLEIYIMRSVGATSGFIRFPFVVEGMMLGLVAGGAGYGLLYFVYSQLAKMFTFGNERMTLIPFSQVWGVLLVGFLAGGILTGMLGSAISMGKYLKEQGSNPD